MDALTEEKTSTGGGRPSPRHLLRVLLRRLWLIVLVAVVLAGSALGFSLVQTPTYEATAKILIAQKETTDSSPGSLSGEVQGLRDFAPTMARAVTTRPVVQAVAERLQLPGESVGQILGRLDAQQEPNTTFIDIVYRDSDPQRAQLIANTTAQVFSEQVSRVSTDVNGVTATVWEQAVLPENPVSPKPVRNSILALALGILLGVGVAFLLEFLEDDLYSPDNVEGPKAGSTYRG